MFHVGIDDTDSVDGMCTTYLGALLKDELSDFSDVLSLRLVRLNPNIEWKTRGNGSVGLVLETLDEERVRDVVLEYVKEYAVFDEGDTNPGVVFFSGEVPGEFKKFYHDALHRVMDIKAAFDLASSFGAEVFKFKNGRGIVGALAAVDEFYFFAFF